MPCFNGIAVSVHAEGAPLPEYSVQKQSRVNRVNTYIPVPPARVPKDTTSNKPEPSRFAISITLLTPGLSVPYSTPKATLDNPYPRPQLVGPPSGPGVGGAGLVRPYIPTTKNDNETIAAYIYFDGRAKEEVATLLRPGEETWVNSRWVQVPESEGGGLAEREFLFREVGLERWLNGLDLEGKDAAAKIERRRKRFERRRNRKKKNSGSDDDLDMKLKREDSPDVLRYGADDQSPIEKLSDNDLSSNSDSDDDAPPEAAGQIKVAMFRVLASGEIKRGEYSPQFDAHDDDEGSEGGGKDASNGADEADVDHTTSFAKPKTLDPKSISTQTVTGIDGPEKPYATFTFFYRGERQLQKMGILEASKEKKPSAAVAKRRSAGLDLSSVTGQLNTKGTVGFSAFRDTDHVASRKSKSRKRSNGGLASEAMADDSDEDDDDINIVGKLDDVDERDPKSLLSPDDARFQGEIAKGVERIKLKRAHSVEPLESQSRKSSSGTPATGTSPPDSTAPFTTTPNLNINNGMFGKNLPDDAIVGSPLKKQRGSIYDNDDPEGMKRLLNSVGYPPPMGDVLSMAEAAQANKILLPAIDGKMEAEEEL